MSEMPLKTPNIVPSTDAATLRRIIEERMKDLPALPVVVAKILQTAASPEASARDLEAVITLDTGLAAKMLRLANSSFYGQSRRISTLADAVVLLGFNAVRNLALSVSLVSSLAPGGAARVFDWRAYWEHCTGVAACARLLARRQRLPGAAQDEALVAGLLHDIGRLFLGRYCPDLLAEVVLAAQAFRMSMEEAEWRLMGTSHALLGQEIASRWNFPPALAGAIGAHHQPEAWHGDPTLTYLVHAANVLTQQAGIGALDPSPQRLHGDVDAWLALTTVEREDLLAELAAERERTEALLVWEDDGAANAPGLRAALTALSAAIEARDPDGRGHSGRVRDLALACARRLGLSEARMAALEVAALLHDVGEPGVPEHVLSGEGQTAPGELSCVAADTTAGAHLGGRLFGAVTPFILCHRECWDGSGYPAGLRGAQIPMEAQIIAACETWDALRTGDGYRAALPVAAAREALCRGSGTQFDPAVVEALLAGVPSP